MQTPFSRIQLATAVVLAASALSLPAVAQSKPSSGPTSTVIYVGGDDLVLKASDGKLLNYKVPSGVKFAVGGKQVSLSELKPGARITAPVATGFDPRVVASVSVVKGKVYAVTPPDGVTLLLTEGVKELLVPAGTTFMVDGKPLKSSDLKPDMIVEATVVTTAADGDASVTAPATPPMSGTLLLARTAAAGEDLPAAGTNLSLYAMFGILMLSVGLFLRRKPAPVKE